VALSLDKENPRTLFGLNRQHIGGVLLSSQQQDSREQLLMQQRRLPMTFKQAILLALLTSIIAPVMVKIILAYLGL